MEVPSPRLALSLRVVEADGDNSPSSSLRSSQLSQVRLQPAGRASQLRGGGSGGWRGGGGGELLPLADLHMQRKVAELGEDGARGFGEGMEEEESPAEEALARATSAHEGDGLAGDVPGLELGLSESVLLDCKVDMDMTILLADREVEEMVRSDGFWLHAREDLGWEEVRDPSWENAIVFCLLLLLGHLRPCGDRRAAFLDHAREHLGRDERLASCRPREFTACQLLQLCLEGRDVGTGHVELSEQTPFLPPRSPLLLAALSSSRLLLQRREEIVPEKGGIKELVLFASWSMPVPELPRAAGQEPDGNGDVEEEGVMLGAGVGHEGLLVGGGEAPGGGGGGR
mmetsp:Transcript_18702/g.42816  ORF Transcript_18702/g.42816 Transcript_18702/m.42816 type:complete len:342 (+) Transcript_18702:1201-2226(+)